MAENEEDYLHRCFEQRICPACQKPVAKEHGSGQIKDGVFCSLSCYGDWNKEELVRRHHDRMRKGVPDE